MADKTEHDAALAATFAANDFDLNRTGQFAVVPEGYTLHDLQTWQEAPNRIRADHRFTDTGSLVEYLNRFGGDWTMIGADYSKASIAAVIDGNGPGEPRHGEHKARFEAQTDDKLKAWLAICKSPMSQVEFGLFLEDRAVDVISPDAASVMEMVMTFDATKKVSFRSAQRLHDGQRQFQYVEENEARGAVTLPDHFVIMSPVYRGMEPQRVKFMVRYRIEDGKLRFVVQMHDRDQVMRDAFDRCVDAVHVGMKTQRPIYMVG